MDSVPDSVPGLLAIENVAGLGALRLRRTGMAGRPRLRRKVIAIKMDNIKEHERKGLVLGGWPYSFHKRWGLAHIWPKPNMAIDSVRAVYRHWRRRAANRSSPRKPPGGRWDRPELHRPLDLLRHGDTLIHFPPLGSLHGEKQWQTTHFD